jgi:predicted RND superfamily exporter protein
MAMVVVFGMMFFVFKSFSVGWVSVVPNVIPILMNFGIMGWFGIRLDSATSMIAAMGIGIIVDDTIHYLHSYGEALKKTGDHTKAMYQALESKGRPIILTSVILFFGFGVLSISKFVPTSYFGSLSAILMLTALLADLIVLPCLLLQFKPKFR